MKKILFVLLILFSSFIQLKAQKSEISNARKMNLLGRYKKAKESIDKAAAYSKTANDPSMWIVKSITYSGIAADTSVKADYDPLDISLEAFNKAKEADKRNKLDKKDIESAENGLYSAGYNKGIASYNKSHFSDALKYFKLASDVRPGDTSLYLNIGIVSEKLNNKESAKSAYLKLAEMQYRKEPYVYRALAKIYQDEGNADKAIKTIEDAKKVFPEDNALIADELNIYLAAGKTDILIKKLDEAIKNDPKNKTLYFTKAVTYEKMKNYEQAEIEYKQALQVDPDYFDANYNMGALYYNQAAEIIKNANLLPANKTKEYEAEKIKFVKKLGQALPYMEKAYSVNPKSKSVLISLREIYSRMNAKEKYAKVNAELKALD